MSVEVINPTYSSVSKNTSDELSAAEWNAISQAVEDAQEKVNEVILNGGSGSGSSDSHVSMNSKGNLNIETTAADLINNKGAKINIEPYSDLQVKPGDDISLYAHHRVGNENEVSLKILTDTQAIDSSVSSEDCPTKLQVNLAELVLTTKDKAMNPGYDSDDAHILDVTVNSAKGTRGYLKLRASAIDLRSETHGGIALQPKGSDGSDNINKIKFEHGGGDGLEFGTFNTEKTSIFTDEYRFNKNGIWKMATRTKVVSDKYDPEKDPDETTHYKYVKAADDFYDNIDDSDETATTNAIIKTGHALNDGKNRHAKYEEKVSNGEVKKTLEIETVVTIQYAITTPEAGAVIYNEDFYLPDTVADVSKIYTISDFKDAIKTLTVNGVAQKYGTEGDDGVTLSAGAIVKIGTSYYTIIENFSPSIDISSGADLSVKAKGGTLTLGGDFVEFGSDSVDLGEMEDGLYAQYKLTKKNNSKPCDTLKVKVINNTTNAMTFNADSGTFAIDTFCNGDVSIPAKLATPTTAEEATQHIVTVAQCKLYDVVKFVAWAKANNFGPWATT